VAQIAAEFGPSHHLPPPRQTADQLIAIFLLVTAGRPIH
jgi:hypothetical protein